jgi:hypothetical protein
LKPALLVFGEMGMKNLSALLLVAALLTLNIYHLKADIHLGSIASDEARKLLDSEQAPFPSWVFGHIVWEDESTTSATYQLIKGYFGRGITVDAVIIDSPWETHYNSLEFDPILYPKAQ